MTFSGLDDPRESRSGGPRAPAPLGDGMGELSMKEEGQEEEEAEADEHRDYRLRHFRVSLQTKTPASFQAASARVSVVGVSASRHICSRQTHPNGC